MLKFEWKKHQKNRIPVMSYVEAEDLGEMLIQDYKSELLHEPQPIDFEHFLESYLKTDLQYAQIWSDEPGDDILGLTAFDDYPVPIYNDMHKAVVTELVGRGVVLLNSKLLEDNAEGRLRFTALHEAGHWWCHQEHFAIDLYQGNLFSSAKHRGIVCRSQSITANPFGRCISDVDWLERQANWIASSLAMPKSAFQTAAGRILRDLLGLKTNFLPVGMDPDLDVFASHGFAPLIAETFCVSRQAAEIKLDRAGFIREYEISRNEPEQNMLF